MHGARNCDRTVLHSLIIFSKQGRVTDLEELISKFPTEARSCVNLLDRSGLGALHYAAKNGQLGCVKKLVTTLSAEVNLESYDKKTPLHFAATHRRKTATRLSNSGEGVQSSDLRSNVDHTTSREATKLNPNAELNRTAGKSTPVPIPLGPVRPKISCPLVGFLLEHGAAINARDATGRTALHYAAVYGDELSARQLLQATNVDHNVSDHDGMRPLHLAALHEEYGIVEQLINKMASVYVEDNRGCLPIHYACSTGNLALVQLLCANLEQSEVRTIMNMINHEMETSLHWAVSHGHTGLTDYCLKMGADVAITTRSGETCLHKAALNGSLEIVTLLLDRGASLDATDELAQTALHKAVLQKETELIRYFIKRGVDTEVQDINSYTPLLLCTSKGCIEAAEVLIEAGANIFAQMADGRTLVHLCVEENQHDFLKVILKHPNAESLVHVGDMFNKTPLHLAAEKGNEEILKLLIENGASIEVKDDMGRTALHYAAEHGHLNIASYLLLRCPQLLNTLDDASNTATHYASQNGHSNLLQLLIENGALPHTQNSHFYTPLDYAAASGHLECAAILLKHNVPINPTGQSKHSPLHLACRNGREAMVSMLLQWGTDPGIRITGDGSKEYEGLNALDVAIDSGHGSCAMAILRDSRWKSALRNQRINKYRMLVTPFRKLIVHMPDVAEFVLNKCSVESAEKKNAFEFIDDQNAMWIESFPEEKKITGNSVPHSTKDSRLVSKQHPHLQKHSHEAYQANENSSTNPTSSPDHTNYQWSKENHPLIYMVRYKRSRLLQHPVVTELLNVKWSRISLLYYVNLLLYIAFLVCYSVYITKAKPLDAVVYKLSKGNVLRNMSDHERCITLSKKATEAPNTSSAMPIAFAILILASVNLLKEVIQMFLKGFSYINYENLTELAIFTLAIIATADFDKCRWQMQLRTNWQWQCAAMGIFLTWINLLLFLRLVPVLGIFVLMFTVVLKSFLKFSVVFLLFIVAFAFGFHALFANQLAFSNVPISLLKTFVMMLGEFEYETTFNGDGQVEPSDRVLLFTVVTYALFPTFLIIMTILVMNLLIGLAVDDIKSVQREASLKRRVMQITLILDIESVLIPCPIIFRASRRIWLYQRRVMDCCISPIRRLIRAVYRRELQLETTSGWGPDISSQNEYLALKQDQPFSHGISASAESLSAY